MVSPPTPSCCTTAVANVTHICQNAQMETKIVVMYGQEVEVKVYPAAWAAGDKREKERLGLKPENPFQRLRGSAVKKRSKWGSGKLKRKHRGGTQYEKS